MKSDRRLPVAIVGAGFSGTMVAAQLARRGIQSILIEGNGRAGKGLAYSTREAAHVLNLRAETMSAWPDDLGHFTRAVEKDGVGALDFAQRRRFGRYLGEILDEAVETGRVRLIEQRALAAQPIGDCWAIQLDDGERIDASGLVLATGNARPEPLKGDSVRLINDPWGPRALAAIDRLAGSDDDVLLVGTGLTMVDTVLALDAASFRGRIVALSRRGLIPKGHSEHVPAPVELDEVPIGSVRALWQWLRRRSAEVNWRAAVNSLRPHSQAIWQSLSLDQQRRFLRHARPWWDVHRHRIAPDVSARLKELIAEGRLEIVAGRILSVADENGGIRVSWRRRGAERTEDRSFAVMINCTGPLGAIERTRNPLIRQMLDDGLARPDPLGIGLEVDQRSRVARSEQAWAMGPLAKGRYWEIIAVPDIREQAADVADDIALELNR